MKKEGIAFILSAPSGTGKTTVCKMLLDRMPDLRFSISHTTRPPRDAEKNGRDYYFVSHQDFQKKIQRGEFIEWARICNDYYGTALDSIRKGLENGRDLLLELDVQGASTLRKNEFPGVYIFILPPSLHELEARLKKRATESDEKIRQRLEKGKEEIKMHGLYDYITTNDEVEKTVETVAAIIRAEKCRADRYIPPSPDIEALMKSKVKS